MVVEAIQARHRQGFAMANVGKCDRALAGAAVRRFGSWRRAMEAAGLEPAQKKWSKDRIIFELRVVHHTRKAGAEKRGKLLEGAAIRYFGSMRAAYAAAGIDPDYNKWSKQRVIEAIQDRYVTGLSSRRNECEDRSLVSAATRHFGHWDSALVAAGLDPTYCEPKQRPVSNREPLVAMVIPPRGMKDVFHVIKKGCKPCRAKLSSAASSSARRRNAG
jgi:hypothetical protein